MADILAMAQLSGLLKENSSPMAINQILVPLQVVQRTLTDIFLFCFFVMIYGGIKNPQNIFPSLCNYTNGQLNDSIKRLQLSFLPGILKNVTLHKNENFKIQKSFNFFFFLSMFFDLCFWKKKKKENLGKINEKQKH